MCPQSHIVTRGAAFCTAFYGFLRASEFTSPSTHTFDNNQTLLLTDICFQEDRCFMKLKASKTDPFHHGTTITLASIASSTCPVTALRKCLACDLNHPLDTPFFSYPGDYIPGVFPLMMVTTNYAFCYHYGDS